MEQGITLAKKSLLAGNELEPVLSRLLVLSARTDFSILLLLAINAVIYWSTPSGYFLADDFVHVAYLKEVFAGHPELLFQNFWSTWMQTAGTQFYRPLISITLALDYLFWGSNSVGFHLTNIFYHFLACLALYLFVRKLMGLLSRARANCGSLIALASAALFCANPLHPEVVSWIIARVDSVCTAFYLLALWCFLGTLAKEREMLWKIACACLFVLALLSKEMAVSFPATAFLLVLVFPELQQPEPVEDEISFKARFYRAFKATRILWMLLILYLGWRTYALGAVLGGYQGSIGEGFADSIKSRLLDLASWYRVIAPVNCEILGGQARLIGRLILAISFASLFISLVRLSGSANMKKQIRFYLFGGFWFLLTILPALPVWNLTESLQGARFSYMCTAPLAMLFALLLLPFYAIWEADSRNPWLAPLKRFSILLFVSFFSVYVFLAVVNNSVWVHAGKELRALRLALNAKLAEISDEKKLVLLDLPHQYKGAHMLYNAATLSVMLEPPLSARDLRSRVVTLEPVLFGDANLVRVSRLKEMAKQNNSHVFFSWNRAEQRLQELYFKTVSSEENSEPVYCFAEGQVIEPGKALISPHLSWQPLAVDYIELDLAISAVENKSQEPSLPLALDWKGSQPAVGDKVPRLVLPLDVKKSSQKVRFHVSEHKSWFICGDVERLILWTPASGYRINVEKITAKSGDEIIPRLFPVIRSTDDDFNFNAGNAKIRKWKEDESGVIRFGANGANQIELTFDLVGMEQKSDTVKILVEISKPDAWFEHYSGSYRDEKPFSGEHESLLVDIKDFAKTGNAVLPLSLFPRSGFYQVRIAALSKNGEISGYFSDPLQLQVQK